MSMFTPAQMEVHNNKRDMQAWILSNDDKVHIRPSFRFPKTKLCLPDISAQDRDRSPDEDPDTSSSISGSSTHGHDDIAQLEGLFQIPTKHLLPGMGHRPRPSISSTGYSYASSYTSPDSEAEKYQKSSGRRGYVNAAGVPSASSTGHRSRYTQNSFDSTASSSSSDKSSAFIHRIPLEQKAAPRPIRTPDSHLFHDWDCYQQLTLSVLSIRKTWASLESTRGIETQQINLELTTSLSRLISADGCTLFEYHISHLLPGSNHTARMKKLWQSLAPGQKTYWRKHSSKFQLPLAFEHGQLALRNLETEDNSERYSSMIRKAKRILEDASVDSEGCLIANPNWRHPVPERELKLWRLDTFPATRKLRRKLQRLSTTYGRLRENLCRNLVPFIGVTGWTMFGYHGIPRVEEEMEQEVMAKLRAIWNGMTADDRLYWVELTARLIHGLRCGNADVLVVFNFDAWAVKEARNSAAAWARLLV